MGKILDEEFKRKVKKHFKRYGKLYILGSLAIATILGYRYGYKRGKNSISQPIHPQPDIPKPQKNLSEGHNTSSPGILVELNRPKLVLSNPSKTSSKSSIQPRIQHPATKAVCQYSLGGKFLKEYPSCREAYKALSRNESSSGISKCCKGKSNSFDGYLWKYRDDVIGADIPVMKKRDR